MTKQAITLRSFADPNPDLRGKSILITGGTGSFGRAFARRLLERHEPRKVIVFSRDEQKQYEMAHDAFLQTREPIRFFIGDVRDKDRLELAMRDVDIVVHAAALKQVPAAEYNPFECIRTNVHGAENVVAAALRSPRVQKVIALSTDKAANPINLYGASKLASDKIFVAANSLSGRDGAHFSVVRYGNVVGSRGSVVPMFRRLIREGAKRLPVTDPRMTRFLITLEQGVSFVLSSLAGMVGGEIYVPKIPSVRMMDVARALLPDSDPEIVGIRPGEKIHEVLITEDDARTSFDLGDRYVILPAFEQLERGKVGGAPLPDGFIYSSRTNEEWLDNAGILALLTAIGE
jgi:UDP-N-acetylglucosamine 4,6-dehydratase/5-epimerase